MNNFYLSEISRFIEFLSNLSQTDVDNITSGKSKIDYCIKSQVARKNSSVKYVDFNPQTIVTCLDSSTSREEGIKYLTEQKLSNEELELVLKLLDVPYSQKDNKSKMTDKIIESTIGYRLRSNAIQDKE